MLRPTSNKGNYGPRLQIPKEEKQVLAHALDLAWKLLCSAQGSSSAEDVVRSQASSGSLPFEESNACRVWDRDSSQCQVYCSGCEYSIDLASGRQDTF